ncbi:hypothetical protein LJB92_01880 [Bacteroidales bacterium OttesenSCG-928-M06]|nr:hypothetical protein [Bacteroidales bacterium OttesenSCG-928-M06]
MKAFDYLEKWFFAIMDENKDISIKYHYDAQNAIHYIAIDPYDQLIENDAYCEKENCVYDQLKLRYPEETFLFGKEGFNFNLPADSLLYKKVIHSQEYSHIIPSEEEFQLNLSKSLIKNKFSTEEKALWLDYGKFALI